MLFGVVCYDFILWTHELDVLDKLMEGFTSCLQSEFRTFARRSQPVIANDDISDDKGVFIFD